MLLGGLVGLGALAYMVKGTNLGAVASTAVPTTEPSAEGLVWYGMDPSWANWGSNALCWLKRMGYAPAWMGATLVPTGVNPTAHMIVRDSPCMKTYTPAAGITNPSSKVNVANALKAVPNVYYHLAHGDYAAVQSGQGEWIYANDFYIAVPEVKTKGKFAFLGSCGAFDDPSELDLDKLDSVSKASMNALNSLVGSHILPDAFTKAWETVVGYKDIQSMKDWTVSLEWQDVMFSQLASGETVQYACRYAAGEIGSSAEQVPEMMGHYAIVGNLNNRLVEV
jgi:hypothetical protein